MKETNNYVSMSISRETKELLNKIRGDKNISYSKIIQNLIEQTGGVIVDDVLEIQREKVAFTLKFWNETSNKVRDVSFYDLRGVPVGTVFYVVDEPVGESWVNSSAKVLAKDGENVILLMTETSNQHGVLHTVETVVHVCLF